MYNLRSTHRSGSITFANEPWPGRGNEFPMPAQRDPPTAVPPLRGGERLDRDAALDGYGRRHPNLRRGDTIDVHVHRMISIISES